jgi:hypothetical protein
MYSSMSAKNDPGGSSHAPSACTIEVKSKAKDITPF